MVLALCVLVSYCGVQAILIDLLAKLLKGLFGYGYWLAGPAMLLAGGILLLHRGRPVTLRTTCALLLPLLLDFGLLEFVGALLTKVMRPLFKVPGRAAVDCITSWIGDGTLGVMLTCNQYEGGYYTAKEASIIATLFSAVSITFTLVVLDTVGMLDKFGIYYLIVCLVGIVCAIADKDDTIVIETAGDRSKIRLARWSIQQNITATERAAQEQAANKENKK